MKLFPKIITGFLHQQNKGSCDWGWQGLVAYGCHNLITVIDPKTVQTVQVLDRHKGNVVKVKWAKENYHHGLNSPYQLRLASADSNGTLIVWNVAQGEVCSEFSDGMRPVLDLDWLSSQDASHDLLVALHPPYSLVLWNADTGTRLWKKSYTETLLSFSFDPFSSRNVAFLGQDCVVFVDDFAITKTPSSNGKKYYVSSPSAGASSLERKSSSKTLAKRMSRILVGDTKPVKPSPGMGDEEATTVTDCLQLEYHKACRHHVLLLYARELLILDLQINQTVGIIATDRSGSPFVQVLPCWQRDALMCLHENGSISMRVRKKTNVMSTPAMEGSGAFDDTPPQVMLDVSYDLRCQSDPLRVTRQNKVSGVALCPLTEVAVTLVMSDSRVLFWELKPTQSKARSQGASPLSTPGFGLPPASPGIPRDLKFPLLTDLPYPKSTLSDMISHAQLQLQPGSAVHPGHSVQLRFLLTGLQNSISSHVSVMRMCPPLTNRNISIYQPLLALGTFTGSLLVFNCASGQLEREFSLTTLPIRGIEWGGLRTILCYAYQNPNPNGLVKNEILYIDTLSGRVTPVRQYREEECAIDGLQVSHFRQYFILTFKEKPVELWDLRSLTLIRELPRNFPRPTAAVWSPSHSQKTLRKKLLDSGSQDEKIRSDSDLTQPTGSSSTSSDSGLTEKKPVSAREHFVMTDKEGTVFHLIVEGSALTDVTKIPPESALGTVACLAWKSDYLVFGDVEGMLCVWDLKAKVSRTTPSNRGWIKKIRFASGRENFKFFTLHNDGLQIWEGKDGMGEMQNGLRSPRDIAKIVDAEWVGSDRPAVVTSHGSIYLFDLNLKSATSAMNMWDLSSPVLCPHLLPPRASQLMKSLLQHQAWNKEYSLTLEGMREEDQEIQTLANAQLHLIKRTLANYLPKCHFGTAQRCLLVARLFGDESEVHFWTVALHYLRFWRTQPKPVVTTDSRDMFVPITPSYKEASDLVVLDDVDGAGDLEQQRLLFQDQPLERCYDTLCDNASFKKYQLDRLTLHDSKRATYEHTQTCAEDYILLGHTDRAVQLLLETEPENNNYYIDSLRACLVASVRSSGASQSTIKLVATNLIASGKLSEGIQLLCLINKSLDACRYLQTYGSWDQAVWLAKSTLDSGDCNEVMKRWADHLCSPQVNQKSKAMLILLSLGHFHRVLEMLYGMRSFDTAACFIESCMEFHLMEKMPETKSLIEAVFLEYARLLSNLGHCKAAQYYCHLAGEKGKQLSKEVEILFA